MGWLSRLWRRPPAGVEEAPQPAGRDAAEDEFIQRARRIQTLREAVAGLRAKDDASPAKAWVRPTLFPGVVPEGTEMAMDSAIDEAYGWAAQNSLFSEGLGFLGYPYLAELAQRPEYRRISETFAKEMTRKWIRIVSTGEEGGGADLLARAKDLKRQYRETDPSDVEAIEDLQRQWAALFDEQDAASTPKAEKLKRIEGAMKRLKVRDAFRRVTELDGFFGRGHIYLDFGDDAPDELNTPISKDGKVSSAKIAKGSLKRLQIVEPVWTYPNAYNSSDPLKADYFKPETWFVMGKQVHASRLLTFVGREVPDLLKPAYSFGGLSLSQMAKPYVDNWLRTRQSVSDAISNFSIMVLLTNLSTVLNAGGSEEMHLRAELFNVARDNKGLMLADKQTEDLKNVSMPLSGLDELQAQSQEHICSVSGIPLVVYTGLSPHGLNASSEGEIRVFYDRINAEQEDQYTDPLNEVMQIIQLSEFGEVDPEIGFVFEPLWSLDAVALANKRKIEADTDCELIDRGVIDPSEARARLAADEDSPYAALDLNKEITPPEQPEGGEGSDEDIASLLAGDAWADDFAEDAGKWDEAGHDRAPNGEFGSGSTVEMTGNELGGSSDINDLRNQAKSAAKQFVGKKFTNSATGHAILVTGNGVGHTIYGAGQDLLKTVPAIPHLIERAEHVRTEPDKRADGNTKAVETYRAPLTLGGAPYDAYLTVKVGHDGRRYYDHGIVERKGG